MTTDVVGIRIAETFAAAGATGYLHAATLDGGRDVGHEADAPVVMASTFKVPLLIEVLARAEAGAFALTDRVSVTPDQRVVGPTGLSVVQDAVEMSVRDLALSMMSVSDNTATDVLLDMVGGVGAVNERLAALGLSRTHLVGDCGDLIAEIWATAAIQPGETGAAIGDERLSRCAGLDPPRTTRTTPREMTTLLRAVWNDEAVSPAACAEARRIMSLQVWPHRLRTGFPSEVKVAAKTGTLFYWRNEAGVVTFLDGAAYAVAVFTRAHSPADVQPAVDGAIGGSARIAVDALRA